MKKLFVRGFKSLFLIIKYISDFGAFSKNFLNTTLFNLINPEFSGIKATPNPPETNPKITSISYASCITFGSKLAFLQNSIILSYIPNAPLLLGNKIKFSFLMSFIEISFSLLEYYFC